MIWLAAHSIALIALTIGFAASVHGPTGGFAAILLTAEGIVAFGWLFAEGGFAARRPANAVTSVRLVVAIGLLAALVRPAPGQELAAALFAAAVLGEVTDFLDGLVARHSGATAFGARLDMETDALFILALSLVAHSWYGVPVWVLGAGLIRYAAAVPFLFLPEPSFPRTFSRYAKTACAAAVILLLASIVPLRVDAGLRAAVGAVAVVILVVSFVWEAVLRLRALRSEANHASALSPGLLMSVLTYYGVPLRQFSIRRLYRRFVSPGDLVFDIGAHVGNRIVALRGLGARVVAVEPQPRCVQLLRRLFDDDPNVKIVAGACGRTEGKATLRISSVHPTLSTLSDHWVRSIQEHYTSHAIEWDQSVQVPTTTLDALITRHGPPRFVKIDVEGFEPEVLEGLSAPIDVISFEFLPASIDPAIEALERVSRLGTYRFNYSMVETMKLTLDEFCGADEMRQILRAMPVDGRSGDIYAIRGDA